MSVMLEFILKLLIIRVMELLKKSNPIKKSPPPPTSHLTHLPPRVQRTYHPPLNFIPVTHPNPLYYFLK